MDSSGEKNDGKGLPWTEEAKFQFLIRIVAQLRENGRTINWQKINMPGRTVKSMQNMWTKINKMIAEVEQETGETPILRPTPRKRTPKRSPTGSQEDDQGTPTKASLKTTPQKRAASKSGGPSAKRAKKTGNAGEGDAAGFKSEGTVDDDGSF